MRDVNAEKNGRCGRSSSRTSREARSENNNRWEGSRMGAILCYPGSYYEEYKTVKDLKESTQDILGSQEEIECLRKSNHEDIEKLDESRRKTEGKMREKARAGERIMVEVLFGQVKTAQKKIRCLNRNLQVLDAIEFKLFQVNASKKLVQVTKNTSATVSRTLKDGDMAAVDAASDQSFDADEKLSEIGSAWNEFISTQRNDILDDPDHDDTEDIDKIMKEASVGSGMDSETTTDPNRNDPNTVSTFGRDNMDQNELLKSLSGAPLDNPTTNGKEPVSDLIPS